MDELTMNDGSPIDETYWSATEKFDSIEEWAQSHGWTLEAVLEEGVWEHDETGIIFFPRYMEDWFSSS